MNLGHCLANEILLFVSEGSEVVFSIQNGTDGSLSKRKSLRNVLAISLMSSAMGCGLLCRSDFATEQET